MTVVAGCTDGQDVWMACDTLSVDTWDLKGSVDTKIILLPVGDKHEAAIGVTGPGWFLQALRYKLKLPDAPDLADAPDLDRWAHAVSLAVTAIAGITESDGRHTLPSQMLLGFAGHMWLISSDEAFRAGPFAAVGSGREYALGALHALEVDDVIVDPLPRLRVAVDAACRFDVHCGGEPVFITV